ncbi:MAG: ferredoxin:glutaredoxin reductase [Candidatus Bathyarchaeota archaeon]|nr:ferredoxin:glutaredoxin reductase [Candidatus Bathyarchaeota archaeon]
MEQVKQRAEQDASSHGYYLNPDPQFLTDLFDGLKVNEDRYGYPSCPCRPGSGVYNNDRDIICPCDYRDPDVADYGACYCSLYVNKQVYDSGKPIPIPERRPLDKMFPNTEPNQQPSTMSVKDTTRKMWFCEQCGYVTFREEPPYICPICKAKREFFKEIKPEILIKTS